VEKLRQAGVAGALAREVQAFKPLRTEC